MFVKKLFVFFLAIAATIVAVAAASDNESHEVRADDAVSNATSLTPQLPPLDIRLSLGSTKRNIGQLRGGKLYDKIYRALNFLCPPEGRGCKEKHHFNIRHETVINGKMEKEHIVITADRGYWGKHKGSKALRRLMIGTIAGAVERMAGDEKNCYDHGLGGRHCNVGDFVSVTLGRDDWFMDIRLSGGAGAGKFDCVAVIEAADGYVKTLEGEYLKSVESLSLWANDVHFNTHCLGTEVTRRAEDGE